METRVNYILTGLFVIVLTTVTLGFGLWLASDFRINRYHTYLTFFSESVAGLNVNAPVKYRGVEVGRVRDLRLDSEHPTRVRVLMDIAEGTPIRTDTYALLKVQGMTGIAFVELEGGEHGKFLSSPLPDGRTPVIVSRPSPYNRLDEALGRAAQRIDEVGDRLVELLSQDNIASLHRTLHNLERLTAVLDRDRERIDAVLANAEAFSSTLASAGESLPTLMLEARRLLTEYNRLGRELEATAITINRLGERLDSTTAGLGRELRDTVRSMKAEMHRMSFEISGTARDIRALTRKLNDQPNVLIYGDPQPPPGPGE